MEDVINALTGSIHGCRVAQITLVEIDAMDDARQVATAASDEVVESANGIAARDECVRKV